MCIRDRRYYGLNSADYEGVMLYTAESSMSAQEILLVKTKTTEQAEEVKAAVEQRRANSCLLYTSDCKRADLP